MLEPVDVIRGTVAATTVAQWGGLAALTAVHAPGGLRQEFAHVWRRDGVVLARTPCHRWSGAAAPRASAPGRGAATRKLRPPAATLWTS